MRLPAEAVTRAVWLNCTVCGESRFVNALIKDSRDDEGERCVEVEIHPRDHDIATRFGRLHLGPRAMVCGA